MGNLAFLELGLWGEIYQWCHFAHTKRLKQCHLSL